MRRPVLLSVLFTLVASAMPSVSAGFPWETDWDKAFERAREERKLVFVDFWAVWCGPCRMMEDEVFPRRAVREKLKHFVLLKVDFDKGPTARRKGVRVIPTYVVYDPAERERFRISGGMPADRFANAIGGIAAESSAFLMAADLLEQKNEAGAAMLVGNAYLRLSLGNDTRAAFRQARRTGTSASAKRLAEIHEAFTWTVEKRAARSVKELRVLAQRPANDESDAVAWYFLGRAAEAAEDLATAREAYGRAQSGAGDDSEAARSARERLAALEPPRP